MAPAPARFDHLVIGAADLARGVAAIQTRLGVAPGGYGAHAAMGTHNALWRLDAAPAADGAPVPAYLEVIAIDPAAPAPGRPRWFGLDDPAVAASLAGGPRPLTWQVRPAAGVDAALAALAAAGVDAGAAMALARDDLRWRLSVRDDGAATLGGACPVVIEWAPGLILPPERLPPSGLTLQHIALSPPPGDEAALAAALAALGADGLAEVAPPGRPAVTATLATPAGAVTLA